jgi:hypothetical protein
VHILRARFVAKLVRKIAHHSTGSIQTINKQIKPVRNPGGSSQDASWVSQSSNLALSANGCGSGDCFMSISWLLTMNVEMRPELTGESSLRFPEKPQERW